MDIDRFYDAAPGTSSQILTALEILKQAIDLLGQAQQSTIAIETDRIVQRFKLLLPKLFQCRAVGDGFGMIITSVHVAFENLNGTPATQVQIRTIWRILRELRNVPAMSVDHALRSIDEMEATGLEVDAPEVGTLLEEFDATELMPMLKRRFLPTFSSSPKVQNKRGRWRRCIDMSVRCYPYIRLKNGRPGL